MSKSLKKLIDINRLREFKNKLVGTDSAYVQTAAVDQTIAGTKTFSKPIVGSVTGSSGSCTGNAATATKATKDAAGNTITTTYATKAENNTKANDSDVVHKSGDESIAGTKTFSSNIVGNLTGNVTGNAATATTATTAGACTGNAATATKLQTARTINGTSFNGTANITTANWGTARNITITDGTNTSTAVSVNGSANVALKLPATIKANLTGNAASATKLQTARTINGIAFDGTANITIPVTAPAGVIIPFAGKSVPTGYLLCNGAAVSRTNYANLFAAIGTLYGAGNGSTTFNLPDARDRVLQGASGKHSAGSYIAAGLPNITGTFNGVVGGSGAFSANGGGAYYMHTDNPTNLRHTIVDFNAARSSTIYGASSTVQSPAIATNFIIKY